MNVDAGTVWNWENQRSEPDLRVLPRVHAFLGYEPEATSPRGQGEGLVRFRRARGMSQEEMARALGIDPSTLARWEAGTAKPAGAILDRVRRTSPWRDGLGALLEAAESS